ncbi:MAG: YXWGXW repeat-containing protein [Bacteroidota bacterium]|nr:YXWGXW repeat-containing protein [Bacteroidota bacterium]
MKNIVAIVVTALLLSSCGPARVVNERPPDVIYNRPPAPGPGYVWMNGDWYWRGSLYEWRPGRWVRTRPGRRWYDGHWQQRGRGWRWNRGYWR